MVEEFLNAARGPFHPRLCSKVGLGFLPPPSGPESPALGTSQVPAARRGTKSSSMGCLTWAGGALASGLWFPF